MAEAVDRQAPDSGSLTRVVRRAKWFMAAALLLPFAALFGVSRGATSAIARRLAQPLAAAAGRLGGWLERPAPQPLPPTKEAEAIARLTGELPPAVPSGSAAASAGPAAHAAAPVGIVISRERVLAAARAGIHPGGDTVSASGRRPAGVAVSGVAALGVGLRDGDVLTRVGGTATRTPAAVIAAARGALRSGATAITGEVWRDQLRMMVTVELPPWQGAAADDAGPGLPDSDANDGDRLADAGDGATTPGR